MNYILSYLLKENKELLAVVHFKEQRADGLHGGRPRDDVGEGRMIFVHAEPLIPGVCTDVAKDGLASVTFN